MDGLTNQPLQNDTGQNKQADQLQKKTIRKYFFWIILVVAVFGAAAIFIHILLNYPRFQKYLIHRLSYASPYEIQTGRIRINYRDGLGIQLQDVVARSKRAPHTLEATQINLGFQYKALLNGRFFPEKAIIQDARIEFKTTQKRTGSMTPDRFSDFQARIEPFLSDSRWIEINNTTIVYTESKYSLNNLNVRIRPAPDDPRQRQVRINGILTDGVVPASFQLNGFVNHPSSNGDRPSLAFDVQLTDMPLARFPWPQRVRFDGGRASGDFNITGPVENRLTLTGNISGRDLNFSVNRKGRSKKYDISQAKINLDGQIGLDGIQIEKIAIQTSEAQVGLGLNLKWKDPANLVMDLDIQSRSIPLPVFKRIFPTPLVPAWIEAKLFPLFTGGTARLDRLRLNGTIDQMKKLKRPENADVFEMRLTLDRMQALPENPDLVVSDVNGEVVIHQGRLLVNGVNGRFAESTLTKGTLLWPNLYNKSRQYTLGIQGDFQLENLKRQGIQPILPAVVRRETDRIAAAHGPMTADIELAFSGKKQLPALTGKLSLKDSRIHHTALSLPLDLHTGRFHFGENGTIQVNGNGSWGTSDFAISGTTGRLWKADGPIRQPLLNLDIDADIDLADTLTLRTMTILPAAWRKNLSGIKTINGRMATDVRIRRTTINDPIRLTGTLTVGAVELTHASIKLPLDIRDGKMELTTEGNSRFSADGAWGRSSFTAEGTADLQHKSMQVALATKADVNEMMDHYYPQARSIFRLNHPLNGQVRIRKTVTRWSFEGEADLDSQVITLPAGVIAPPDTGNRLIFDIGYSPGELILNSCRFLGKTSRLTLSTSIQRSGVPLTLDVTADPLDLTDLGLRVNGGMDHENPLVKGELRGHINAVWPLDLPTNPRLNGSLTVDGFMIADTTGSLAYQADLRFEDRDIDILNLTFPIGGQKGILKGRLTGWDHWRGRLDLDMDCIDLSRLIDRLRAASTGKRQPFADLLTGADVKMDIRANQVIWETIDLGNFSTTLQYQNDRLRIEKAIFTAPSSLIKLSGSLSGENNKTISLLTYFKLDQAPLDTILQGMHLSTDRLNGILSLEGGLALRGRNKAEIIQNLAGKLNILVADGVVQRPNVIIKILDYLSIQNIFIKRPSDSLKSRFYFESIKGHVTIEKGKFVTDRLFMKSPVFNAAVRGEFDLPRNHMNYLVGVQPLNTIDRIISKIPIVGHILTGAKKTILVYYFKIRGNPNNVVVKHIPFKNLDDAIVGYFKRTFLTPTRLWTKISNTLEGIGDDIQSGVLQPDPTDSPNIGP